MDVRSLGSYGAEVTGGYGSPRIGAGIEPKSSAKVNHGIVISPNLGKVPPGGGGGESSYCGVTTEHGTENKDCCYSISTQCSAIHGRK